MEKLFLTFDELNLLPKQYGIYAIHNLKDGMQYIGRGQLRFRLTRHRLHAMRGDTYLPIYTVMHHGGLDNFRIEVVHMQENHDKQTLATLEKATITERARVATLYNRTHYKKQRAKTNESHMLVSYAGESTRGPRLIPKGLSGIYRIYRESAPDKVYVGKSIDLKGRYSTHAYSVRRNHLQIRELYQDMQCLGLEQFCFEVVEVCLEEKLLERERYWIQSYNALEAGYNDRLPQTREELTQEINARLARGEEIADIAKVCDASKNTVRRVKDRGEWKQLVEGVLPKKGKIYDEHTIRAVHTARAEGHTTNELMAQFGLTHKALEAILLGGYWQEISTDEQPIKKIRSIKSDFTDEERGEIKILLLLGTDFEEMRQQYGLCKEYLKQIAQGKCWTDVIVEPDSSFTRKSKQLTPEMVAHLKYILSQGFTYNELARYYELNPSPIKSIWRGKTWREVLPLAPDNAEEIISKITSQRASLKRKLTEEKVASIKQSLLQGVSIKELAQTFEVGTTTIKKIKDGEIWAKVSPHIAEN